MMSYVCADVLWLGAGASLYALSFEIRGNMIVRNIGGKAKDEGIARGRHSLVHTGDISAIVPIRSYHRRSKRRGEESGEEEGDVEMGKEKEERGEEEEEGMRGSSYLMNFEWTEGVSEVLTLDLNGVCDRSFCFSFSSFDLSLFRFVCVFEMEKE